MRKRGERGVTLIFLLITGPTPELIILDKTLFIIYRAEREFEFLSTIQKANRHRNTECRRYRSYGITLLQLLEGIKCLFPARRGKLKNHTMRKDRNSKEM